MDSAELSLNQTKLSVEKLYEGYKDYKDYELILN